MSVTRDTGGCDMGHGKAVCGLQRPSADKPRAQVALPTGTYGPKASPRARV